MQKKQTKTGNNIGFLFTLLTIFSFEDTFAQNKSVYLGKLKTIEFEGDTIFNQINILTNKLIIYPSDSSGKIDTTNNTNYFLIQFGHYMFLYNNLNYRNPDSSCGLGMRLKEKRTFTRSVTILKLHFRYCRKKHLDIRIGTNCSTYVDFWLVRKSKKYAVIKRLE